jgi:hypothetical protein
MGVGVLLWVAGKRFLIKHVVEGMLPSPVTDPSAVPSDVTLFPMSGSSPLKVDSLYVAFSRSQLTTDNEHLL